MKIAIIGAGFFGLHLSNELKLFKSDLAITIFEKKSTAFTGAASSNQCRLHQGFHYPRSALTIYQSLSGFEMFKKRYDKSCFKIKENVYSVSNEGYINSTEYLAVMKSFHLDYTEIPTPEYIKKKDCIETSILVPEEYINLKLLYKQLFSSSLNLIFNTNVRTVNDITGNVYDDSGNDLGKFDLIINCSYYNPNLYSSFDFFKIKYEVAHILNTNSSLSPYCAYTLMDGPFYSIYPSSPKTHTVSSVKYTPIYTSNDLADIENYKKNISNDNILNNRVRILDHVLNDVNLKFNVVEDWLSIKVKLNNDHGDSRQTLVRSKNKYLSILCGKLDSAFELSEKIINEYIK